MSGGPGIRAQRLEELDALVAGGEVQRWRSGYVEVRRALAEARARHEAAVLEHALLLTRAELALRAGDGAVLGAGEHGDRVAALAGELNRLDNQSFEALAAFERQRRRATERFGEVGRLEGAPASVVGAATARLRLEEERKRGLWDEVQATRSEAFALSMARAEHGLLAARERRRAEAQFAHATELRGAAEQLQGEVERALEQARELEQRLEAERAAARQRFACALIDEFLYWPKQDDSRLAYCLALFDEPSLYGVEVRALRLYEAQRELGLERLEPARRP